MGALLKSKIRWRDTVSRLGGDEFGVLLESCSLEEAVRNAESLREAIRNTVRWEREYVPARSEYGVVRSAGERRGSRGLCPQRTALARPQGERAQPIYSFQENEIDLCGAGARCNGQRGSTTRSKTAASKSSASSSCRCRIRRSTACTMSCCYACATRPARSSRPTSSSRRRSATG